MTGLLILFAAVFAGIGCYHLSCTFVDVPTAQTSRMMMLARKQTGTSNEKLFDVPRFQLLSGERNAEDRRRN